MARYLLIDAVFLVAAATAMLALAHHPRMPRSKWLALAALVLLTAIFDNIMIIAGIMAYNDLYISGIHLGNVPVEDFAYPLAAVMVVPAVYSAVQRRKND